MANITAQQPIRYQIDSALFSRSGLVIHPGFDCTLATCVDGFTLSGSQPEGTSVAVAFRIDEAWSRIDADGVLNPLPSQSISVDALLEEGNRPAELAALTSIPGFAGKKVGVAVALHAEDPDGYRMPTFGLSIKARASSTQRTKVEESQLFALGAGAQIIKLEAKALVSDGGTAIIEAQTETEGGATSAWGSLDSFAGVKADGVRFRATLNAPDVGVSSAQIERASVQYRGSRGIIAGTGSSEVVSITEDWYLNVRQCRMTIRHKLLKDARIRCYVAFRDKPIIVKGERVGIGSGETTTFQLAHTKGVEHDSVRVYYDGRRAYSGFEVNTVVARVTCAAPEGVVVSVDYQYGWDEEQWHEMEPCSLIPTLDYDATEFRYILPRDETARSVCAVKVAMEMSEGTVEGEQIGYGSGTTRTYPLSRIVRDGKIELTADGERLPLSSWLLTEEADAVRAVVPTGQEISASYDWISETPIVYQFVAVFAD